ncbi:protease complex subunit PrcB family protein [Flavobacterium sp. Sd200]|uniref:protease complex subunit PrcB family protein n=1 Tax=Flavobacterium sp. Sd200 TaxID=2692211 RepID=UPI00136AA6B8|nr:protease complex subunit PrcB family protein [Flavobacterium sp. Sd200]MXN92371.1 protease complex subunit PrcB family protein [Flavobacterium sp. Sd200]
MKRFLAIGLFAIVVAACKTAAPQIGGEGTFDVLKKESIGGREKQGNDVITSQSQLNALYSELNLSDVPEIDFKSNNVVALFMGQKNTGGYSIDVGAVNLTDDVATVQIITTAPQDMAIMVLTTPYCIAKIPKSKKVEFTKSASTPAAE